MVHVLRQLQLPRSPDVLVGAETFDDAGVFRLSEDLALVQTLDFFPPLVDDPFDFGRIAAANALSDVYAMGGVPLTAMNIVGFPDKELPAEVLLEILRGGAEICREAGVSVVGGHSVRDAEVKYGLSVTGRVHPQRILTNAGARAGDRLFLTKPIGSGVLTTAAKKGLITPEGLREAIEVMTALNRAASEAALACGAHACTDVTGFGLLGHAFEMAVASDVSLVINTASVPLLTEVIELAARGCVTRTHAATRTYLGSSLQTEANVNVTLQNVLLDAQTSGGLLVSVAEVHAPRLKVALQSSHAGWSAEIGWIERGSPSRVVLRS